MIETDQSPSDGGGGLFNATVTDNEIKTYRFTVGPEDSIVLDLQLARAESAGVRLSWSGGFPAFRVRRGDSPEPDVGWSELTPTGGTQEFSWVDEGALQGGDSYFYLVEKLPQADWPESVVPVPPIPK